jgi:putative oxidoreductase
MATLAPIAPTARQQLIFPLLGRVYDILAPLSVFLMRAIAGGLLVVHGWPKIQDPFKNVEMVEKLGFVPGAIWSPALAGTEFFGGILIAIGFLTRPAALGATLVLLVTVWFHGVLQGQGLGGAEKSLLWAAITFYFVAHGGGFLSVDRALRREI